LLNSGDSPSPCARFSHFFFYFFLPTLVCPTPLVFFFLRRIFLHGVFINEGPTPTSPFELPLLPGSCRVIAPASCSRLTQWTHCVFPRFLALLGSHFFWPGSGGFRRNAQRSHGFFIPCIRSGYATGVALEPPQDFFPLAMTLFRGSFPLADAFLLRAWICFPPHWAHPVSLVFFRGCSLSCFCLPPTYKVAGSSLWLPLMPNGGTSPSCSNLLRSYPPFSPLGDLATFCVESLTHGFLSSFLRDLLSRVVI